MTPALSTHAAQVRHYASVRARLSPPRPRGPVAAPKREWRTPAIAPLCINARIETILRECGRRKFLTASAVLNITSATFGVPAREIGGESRRHEVVVPRQIGMAICRLKLANTKRGSFPTIGRAFGGRDPTTTSHAFQMYGAQVERVEETMRARGRA